MRRTSKHAPISLGSPSFTTVDAGGFSASEVWFPPSLGLPSHTHDQAVLAVTLSGSIDATLRGRRLESWRKSYWTEPRGEAHGNRVGTQGARVLVVQPSHDRFESLGPVGQWLDGIHHRKDERILHLAQRLRVELHEESPSASIMIESLALDMIVTGFKGRLPKERRLPAYAAQAFDLIQARFPEALTLTGIAESVGVHPAHLAKTFRVFYNRSVGETVREARLRWAVERIEKTDIPLSRIAFESGFTDQSHMNRWIRRYYGKTPTVLRREASGKPLGDSGL